MSEFDATLAVIYQNWALYQSQLVKVIAPLTEEQLALRSAPHLRTIGSLALHIVGARASWFRRLLKEGGPEIAELVAWNRPDAPLRPAAELVSGIEATGCLIQEAVARWTPEDMAYVYSGERNGQPYSLSRAWVIWHLIEHDLHHGGELSLTLGIHQLPALDL